MERIRYKYRKSKEGVCLRDIKCPICGNPINHTENLGGYHWDGKVVLLAECWSGDLDKDMPRHIFLIILSDLPIVEVEKVKKK